MNLMLVALLGAVGVGMFVTHFGRREKLMVCALAVGLPVVYFVRPVFMT